MPLDYEDLKEKILTLKDRYKERESSHGIKRRTQATLEWGSKVAVSCVVSSLSFWGSSGSSTPNNQSNSVGSPNPGVLDPNRRKTQIEQLRKTVWEVDKMIAQGLTWVPRKKENIIMAAYGRLIEQIRESYPDYTAAWNSDLYQLLVEDLVGEEGSIDEKHARLTELELGSKKGDLQRFNSMCNDYRQTLDSLYEEAFRSLRDSNEDAASPTSSSGSLLIS